ncbi:MAG: hypothetical protein M1819_002202 [Sarea resinae]|nr:MAG: hypothetical protein M1819_002202 [Sarea resinae]
MELYACGFNAHNQLNLKRQKKYKNKDLHRFTQVLSAKTIRLLCSGWANTFVEIDGEIILQGHKTNDRDDRTAPPHESTVVSIAGGDASIYAGLLANGQTVVLEGPTEHENSSGEDEFCMAICRDERGGRVMTGYPGHCLAVAGNERVAYYVGQCNPEDGHWVHQSDDPGSHAVYIYCGGGIKKDEDLKFPERIIQLEANQTAFTALTESGVVYTWGDARHNHLGRDITPESPATRPGPVEVLGGIPIKKISSGGWITAALSKDNDLYVWGGRPGESNRIKALPPSSDEGEKVALVDIDGGVDIADVAVGDGHIVVLTCDGRLFAAGRGVNGQLGAGAKKFAEDWMHVNLGLGEGRSIINVYCGPWTSFALVSNANAADGRLVVDEEGGDEDDLQVKEEEGDEDGPGAKRVKEECSDESGPRSKKLKQERGDADAPRPKKMKRPKAKKNKKGKAAKGVPQEKWDRAAERREGNEKLQELP